MINNAIIFFANLCVSKIMHTRIDVIRHEFGEDPPRSRSRALGKLRVDNVKSNHIVVTKIHTLSYRFENQPTGRKSPGALVSVVAPDASAFTRREEEKPPSLANMVRTTTTKRNETNGCASWCWMRARDDVATRPKRAEDGCDGWARVGFFECADRGRGGSLRRVGWVMRRGVRGDDGG
jgi:hypothetical protein